MKLSTRGRYGMRLMLDLAINYQDTPVYLKDIARRQEISEKYLWHLITSLKTAGLVKSLRGAHGGYVLAKPPQEISLKEIVGLLEGSLSLVECVDNPADCHRAQFCAARDIWEEIAQGIDRTLGAISLKDMADKQKHKKGAASSYNI